MFDLFRQHRKRIIIIGAALIVGIVALIVFLYLSSLRTITFHFDTSQAENAVLYKGTQTDDEKTIAPTDSKVLERIKPDQEYRLAKGSYYVVFDGKKIVDHFEGILLEDSDVKKEYIFSLSEDELKHQFKEEKSAIRKVIKDTHPDLSDYYTFKHETLYQQGDWYGGALAYDNKSNPKQTKTSLNRDTLRIILHKDNGTWKIAAGPSVIISNQPDSSIPRDVVDNINTFDSSEPIMPGFTLYDKRFEYGATE